MLSIKHFLLETLQVTIVTVSFLIYVLLWYIKKREIMNKLGIDPNVISISNKPIQKYFGILEKLMKVFIVLIIIVHYLYINIFALTSVLFVLNVFFSVIGYICIFLGFILCRVAQVKIGKSWRVGIDEEAKPGLITTGVYRFVRNPTYSGLFLICIGIFITLPTVLLSYWILIFFVMLEFQVRCEEAYLESKYKEDFIQYAEKTKRYIPWIY